MWKNGLLWRWIASEFFLKKITVKIYKKEYAGVGMMRG
jgi:hypothetical protein